MTDEITPELAMEIAGCSELLLNGGYAQHPNGLLGVVARMYEAMNAIVPFENDRAAELTEALDELRCCVNERAAVEEFVAGTDRSDLISGRMSEAMRRADELLEADMRSSRQVVPTAALANIAEAIGSIEPYDRLLPGVLEALEVAADGGKAVWPS